MNWMRQHLTEAPTVEQAAEAVGVSGTHLRRLFRECLGTTPRAELEKMRLSAADELIRTGRHSLAQISDLLGYSEPSAFSRAYKRHHHRPPSGSRVK
jgi:transcriptional regulator GlxA family with amidase domain